MLFCRKRAEHGFSQYGFKHRAQWVFMGSPSSGEQTQWVPLGLLFACQNELTEFFAELTEFAPKLREAQWVLFSETVLSKQYSVRFLACDKILRSPSWGLFLSWNSCVHGFWGEISLTVSKALVTVKYYLFHKNGHLEPLMAVNGLVSLQTAGEGGVP